jgi:hypothetical protein
MRYAIRLESLDIQGIGVHLIFTRNAIQALQAKDREKVELNASQGWT